MFGKLVSFLAHLLGWTPLGKRVQIEVSESIDGSNYGCLLYGEIIEVIALEPGDSNGKISVLIRLDQPFVHMNQAISIIHAISRHKNYGFYALFLTWIAVYIIPSDNCVEHDWNKGIGIWSLGLIR
ncbi:hypothetical protein [Nitrosomonas sp.]|uniref:hypothetical protein n=1 Tax=Nitrosomonas sp. TaxID=42353 RepID=UPI001DFDF335|nr:hypothetical protein [Nitrosomonas sp.]MBX3618358.1 hypothetical protein [Nitrosomonas sp.]